MSISTIDDIELKAWSARHLPIYLSTTKLATRIFDLESDLAYIDYRNGHITREQFSQRLDEVGREYVRASNSLDYQYDQAYFLARASRDFSPIEFNLDAPSSVRPFDDNALYTQGNSTNKQNNVNLLLSGRPALSVQPTIIAPNIPSRPTAFRIWVDKRLAEAKKSLLTREQKQFKAFTNTPSLISGVASATYIPGIYTAQWRRGRYEAIDRALTNIEMRLDALRKAKEDLMGKGILLSKLSVNPPSAQSAIPIVATPIRTAVPIIPDNPNGKEIRLIGVHRSPAVPRMFLETEDTTNDIGSVNRPRPNHLHDEIKPVIPSHENEFSLHKGIAVPKIPNAPQPQMGRFHFERTLPLHRFN